MTTPVPTSSRNSKTQAESDIRRLLSGKTTAIMGIMNITPDSFSGDGVLQHPGKAVDHALALAQQMINHGADILDIGGESSRPGAKPVNEQEEIDRVIPIVHAISQRFSIPISVDTYKPVVAREALNHGAQIINSIQGTQIGSEMTETIKENNAVIVLMHMRGQPETMQNDTRFGNLIEEIKQSLRSSIEKCLESGISSDKIIIDPGIGFGKTADQNMEIIRRLAEFQDLGMPVLIGPSRKSFIGQILQKDPGDRVWGTAAAVALCVAHGADIVRVHDVREMRDVVAVSEAILSNQNQDQK